MPIAIPGAMVAIIGTVVVVMGAGRVVTPVTPVVTPPVTPPTPEIEISNMKDVYHVIGSFLQICSEYQIFTVSVCYLNFNY